MYWVSCIIQNNPNEKAWLCPCSEGQLTEQAAHRVVDQYIKTFRCLSVWIDKEDNGVMTTIWHKALVDAFGHVENRDK